MAELSNPKVQKILQSKAFAHLATIKANGEPQSSPMLMTLISMRSFAVWLIGSKTIPTEIFTRCWQSTTVFLGATLVLHA